MKRKRIVRLVRVVNKSGRVYFRPHCYYETGRSMKLYQIIGLVTVVKDGWRSTIQTPTFYLREDIQGILHEQHAEQIARDMFRALCPDAVDINVLVGVGTIELHT